MITPIEARKESQFETIYRLAKTNDEKALRSFIQTGVNIDVHRGGETPVMLLASENYEAAVILLISKFKASSNRAVNGAARAGHIKLTIQLLNMGASPKTAIWAAALGNQVTLMNQLLNHFPDKTESAMQGAGAGGHEQLIFNLMNRGLTLDSALYGAASVGNDKLVFKLLDRVNLARYGERVNSAAEGAAYGNHPVLLNRLIECDANLDSAVYGAGVGGHVDIINDLIQRGADPNKAATGIAKGNYVGETVGILPFIATIQHVALRRGILIMAREKNLIQASDCEPTLTKAAKIDHLMKTYKLDYLHARHWNLKTHYWFIQGIQMVKKGRVPLELFLAIFSLVLGLSVKDTKALFLKHREVISKKLHEVSVQAAEEKYHPRSNFLTEFFSTPKPLITREEYLNEIKMADERLGKRTAL